MTVMLATSLTSLLRTGIFRMRLMQYKHSTDEGEKNGEKPISPEAQEKKKST